MTITAFITASLAALILISTMGTSAVTMAATEPERVPVRIDIPAGAELYTGRQPFTFGVPLPKGTLKTKEPVSLVDAQGNALPGQFEVTATWTADGDDVRWLLVDGLAELNEGKASPVYLVFGKAAAGKQQPASTLKVEHRDGDVTVNTGTRTFRFTKDGADLGTFVLRDGAGKTYAAKLGGPVEVERDGPVRAVVKLSGKYLADDGTSIADWTMRVRMYAGSSFARVYHTMVWLTDDNAQIDELSFETHAGAGASAVGIDGKVVPGKDGSIDVRQLAHDKVEGSAQGAQLDGWIQAKGDDASMLVALRWPWQQFPTGFGATSDGQIKVRLIGPADGKPMSLKPNDIAVAGVMTNPDVWNLRVFRKGVPGDDVVGNGPEARPFLSPRGIARTWELLLWSGDEKIAPAVKNTLAQHPVLAFADPEFAVKAELPSPAAPYDAKQFPVVEAALQRAFGYYTNEDAAYGDFGTWNYGDIQWHRTYNGVPIYRYWMNNGKGWSVVPWALWLRSGDRRYWEHGESNSRHVMDVDMCHVPEWERSTKDYKLRGGQYHYSSLHWGYGPQVFTFFIDSEYLPYCYYMTGYERAKDVMLEHAEAIARWEDRDGWMSKFKSDPKQFAGRHIYVMLKNLGALYEATWDPRLKGLMDEVVEVILAAQYDHGNFVHVKTNHYLDESLMIGARIYGWDKFGDSIKRWHESLGDPLQPSTNNHSVHAPMSLWPAVELFRHTGNERYIDVATRMMNTQAACVVDAAGSQWNGLNQIPGHEAGPALRDWPILMSVLREFPAEKRQSGYLPIGRIHGRMKIPADQLTEGWSKLRHIAMTLEQTDGTIDIGLGFMEQPEGGRVRVIAPDGKVVHDSTFDIPTIQVAFEQTPVRLQVPSDGQTGVYVIELLVKSPKQPEFSPAVHISSSTGKLVHWIGEGQVTISCSSYCGQLWLKPLAGQTFSAGWPLNLYVPGRYLLTDEQQNILATTTVTESKPRTLEPKPTSFAVSVPWGAPMSYEVPASHKGLMSLIVSCEDSWHRWIEIKGIEAPVALTKESWFDPNAYPHPDLGGYVK